MAELSFGMKSWLGGRRSCPGCEDFVWSDGTPMDFTNWGKGQPSSTKEDCMENNGTWNDVSCDNPDRGQFVCKKSNRGEMGYQS